MNITLADLLQTKPLTAKESLAIEKQMARDLRKDSGNSLPFRFKVGDKVADFACMIGDYSKPVGTVERLYRENGHNRVATGQGFFREQDLILTQ